MKARTSNQIPTCGFKHINCCKALGTYSKAWSHTKSHIKSLYYRMLFKTWGCSNMDFHSNLLLWLSFPPRWISVIQSKGSLATNVPIVPHTCTCMSHWGIIQLHYIAMAQYDTYFEFKEGVILNIRLKGDCRNKNKNIYWSRF